MNIQAKLIEKHDTQQITASFQKREFVVEFAENPQYPEFVKFELIQSNCDQLENFQVGDQLNISFNLKGRKWTDKNGEVKYFNSLQAWRLDKETSSNAALTPSTPASPAGNKDSKEWQQESFSADDDLPF